MNGRRMGVILEQEEEKIEVLIEVLITPKYNQQGRLHSLPKLCHKLSTEKVPRFSVSGQSSNSSIKQLNW